MGPVKYTYISDVNANMNDINNYVNATNANANDTNADRCAMSVSGYNPINTTPQQKI